MASNVKEKRDNTYCCVPQCKSKGSKCPQISFHKFPDIKSVVRKTTADGRMVFVNRKKEWIKILKIEKKVSKRTVVCSKHFDLDAFTFPPETCKRPRLKPFALPILYLPKTSAYEEINKHKEIPVSSVAAESSSIAQQTSNKHPNHPVLGVSEDTNTIEIVSVASQYTNSSQLSTSPVAVKDQCVLPFAKKSSVESYYTTQAVSSYASLPSVSGTDTNTLRTISNSVSYSLPKIYSSDSSASSELSVSDDSSSSSVVSISDENTSEEVLCTHRSVATQTNFTKRVPHRSVGIQMNFHALKTPKKIFKYRRRFAKTLERLPKAVRVKGRRIIDFQYFFKAIKDVNNHSTDRNNHSEAGCNLNNIFIKREKKHGICTLYFLQCAVCNFKKNIWSENPKSKKKNLNTDFLSAILSIKCSFEEVNLLLSKMRLPLFKPNNFVKEYEKMCKSSNACNNQTNYDILKNLGENLQTEPQISGMPHCSSASDDSDFLEHVDLSGLLVEEQLEIEEENVIENKNEPETIILDHGMTISNDTLISDQEHLMTNSNKTSQNASKNSGENVKGESQLTGAQQCSSASCNSSLFEQVDFGDLIVEDQFEIKEENVIDNKNETETLIPDQSLRTADDKLIAAQEKVILNMTTIKQEINSDDEDLTSSVTNQTKSKESKIDNDAQSVLRAELISSQQKEESTYEKRMIVNQEQINLQNVIENKKEPENIILGQRMRTSDDKFIVDQEQVILNMTTIKQEINSDDEDLTSSVTNETKSVESRTDNHEQSVFRAEPILSQQNEERACTNKMAVNQEQNKLHKNLIINSQVKLGMEMINKNSMTDFDYKSESELPCKKARTEMYKDSNNAIQMPHYAASDTCEGLSGITGISRVPSTIQQPTNASAATYTLLEPAVVQQPVNLSNSMPGVIPGAIWQCTSSSDVQNANGVTYAPLAPTLFQQLVNSSNNTPGEIPTVIRKRKYSPNSD